MVVAIDWPKLVAIDIARRHLASDIHVAVARRCQQDDPRGSDQRLPCGVCSHQVLQFDGFVFAQHNLRRLGSWHLAHLDSQDAPS
jgi:hypothetical protein